MEPMTPIILTKSETDRIFGRYGLTISDGQYERLEKFAEVLTDRNKSINLTAITDPEGITVKHFFDSIYPFTLFDLPKNSSIIDVGTGAGFPACPLKIYRGDLKITLLDSINKRVDFLREVSDLIGLEADCIHGRAEELGRTLQYREKFDCAAARAVAKLPELCEYCLPFVRVGGVFAALKGSSGEEELSLSVNAIEELGGKLEMCKNYQLPGGDGRTLILIRKTAETPSRYPRDKGRIKKRPLQNS